MANPTQPKNLYLSDHPLVHAKICMLRNKSTDSKLFRELIHETALLLGYEATRDFTLRETPGVPVVFVIMQRAGARTAHYLYSIRRAGARRHRARAASRTRTRRRAAHTRSLGGCRSSRNFPRKGTAAARAHDLFSRSRCSQSSIITSCLPMRHTTCASWLIR